MTEYLFTDQENDPESGLMYYGARYYDPWVGRFMSQDPELIGAYPPSGLTGLTGYLTEFWVIERGKFAA